MHFFGGWGVGLVVVSFLNEVHYTIITSPKWRLGVYFVTGSFCFHHIHEFLSLWTASAITHILWSASIVLKSQISKNPYLLWPNGLIPPSVLSSLTQRKLFVSSCEPASSRPLVRTGNACGLHLYFLTTCYSSVLPTVPPQPFCQCTGFFGLVIGTCVVPSNPYPFNVLNNT